MKACSGLSLRKDYTLRDAKFINKVLTQPYPQCGKEHKMIEQLSVTLEEQGRDLSQLLCSPIQNLPGSSTGGYGDSLLTSGHC